MYTIIKVASKELGIREFTGAAHNQRILTYGEETDLSMSDGDETPWCSIFMNWVCMKGGFEMSNKPNARSWLKVGVPVANPEPGDVVVYWRESKTSWKGHVGIFMGYSADASRIYTLGGNQGNSVSISGYAVDRLLEFRRLRRNVIRLTTSDLKRPDKGPEVARLQDTLKMAGYDCGTSDGFFGPQTEQAVNRLKKDAGLAEDGVFDSEAKAYLKSKIAD